MKKDNITIETLSYSNKLAALDEKAKEIEKIRILISSLNNDKNNAIEREKKNESVLKELCSLNQEMNYETNSSHSKKQKSEFNFDISTSDTRSQIIKSIEEKIKIYEEKINFLSKEINAQQEKINKILKTKEFASK
ncbi:hypothetical protein [Metamycoplasma equirhinis]|uniref:hypothetical protein n=1 Tax=Metamycoplasma equirhinis TaxID=92402 RepID=UPI0035936E85